MGLSLSLSLSFLVLSVLFVSSIEGERENKGREGKKKKKGGKKEKKKKKKTAIHQSITQSLHSSPPLSQFPEDMYIDLIN